MPSPSADYRATLNLPTTAFPMRADLAAQEPARVAWWREDRTYERRLARNADGAPWILHDGPPYANGDLHMGHFVNRVLKDVLVKVHLLEGRYAKFRPGWDMHGLPIESETLKHLKIDFRTIDPIELRAKCRERALFWLDKQREAILRMGVLGDYEHPYRTIDASFEGEIVDALADLADAKQMYKGLRSTLWCVRDETALAEAEIEYRDRVSPAVYVRFGANPAQRAELVARLGFEAGDAPIAVLIWTTTPWTLPANVAIALRPEAAYGAYRRGDEIVVLADALAENVLARAEPYDAGGVWERVGGASGAELLGAAVRHPFLDRDSVLVGAEYVELETGTGAVHTAPGHGTDDFETGVRYGLPVLVPVDAGGRFTVDAGPYAGAPIFETQDRIVADLRASGALFASADYEHSYPHCWRCKNPVIYRATAQWFIAMDAQALRARAEAAIAEVSWHPGWGAARMGQMIGNHPEWCVSRQRTWGTPIPAVICRACDETTLDPRVARIAAGRFRRDGANVWWTDDVRAFLPPDFRCPACGGEEFVKEKNIVDIWFESGVTHRAVLGRDGMPWPADAVLEGADQFRGWFRSSLLTAVATRGAAPYKTVVATGWVVDAHGRAMHKSTGNYIPANEAMQTYGADVLRLWVASVEFTTDMRLGKELLGAVGAVYRNLRNRIRVLLGSIGDLRPEDVVADDALEPLDRLALVAFDDLARAVRGHYHGFRLHEVYLALVAFDADDLSRFYIDALKDRLYSSAATSPRRRSAQTALFHILRGLLALAAPVLSFTAEEAWQHVPPALRGEATSVFDLDMPRPADASPQSRIDLETWSILRGMRAVVGSNEGMRDFALRARVVVDDELHPRLVALGDGLREALVVSGLTLEHDATQAEPFVELLAAGGEKCGRCWKWRELRIDALHPTLCAPCAEIVRACELARA